MRIITIQRYIIFIFCLWVPCSVWALGLGSIKTTSYLNQNLESKIMLIGLGNTALNSINAQLASPELFERIGVDYGPELSKLRFSVMQDDAGQPYVRVYSTQPITHPGVAFLLQLTWPGGQLLRQYQVFLTPYVYSSKKGASEGKTAHSVAAYKQYGLTAAQDNLWSVAASTRPDATVSIPQMAIAIFLLNPDAFSDHSPQQLRRGVKLNLPTAVMAKQIPAEAAKTLLAHHKLNPKTLQERYGFKAHLSPAQPAANKAVLAKPVETTAQKAEPNKANTLQPHPAEILAPLIATAPVEAELKLTREALNASEAKNQALQAQLANLQRQQSIVELANKEQLDRIKVLEEKLSTRDSLKTEATSTPPAKETAMLQPLPSAAPVTASKPVSKEKKEEVQSASPGRRLGIHELPVTMVKPSADPQETDTWSPLSVLVWVVAIMVLLAAIGYGFYVRWRNRHEEALVDKEFAQAAQNEDVLSSMESSTIIFTKGDEGDEDIPFQKETLSTKEVEDKEGLLQDPLQESDVYMTYSRFDQAEKVLLAALAQKPEYHACRIKLLELYAKQQDKIKFREALSRIPAVFLMQEAGMMEKVKQLENSLFNTAPQSENDLSQEDNIEMEADNSIPTVEVDIELDEEETQEAELDFSAQGETEKNNKPLPFTAGLDLGSIEKEKQNAFQEGREVITTDEALKRAKQLLESGDRLQAKMLLEEVSQKGDPAEQKEARELLQSLT